MTVVLRDAILVQDARPTSIQDPVVVEAQFRLSVNDTFLTGMIASNDQLREMGAGFVVNEGLATHVTDVTVRGHEIVVHAELVSPPSWEVGTSGGMSSVRPPGTITSDLTLTPSDVQAVTREIESEEWRRTGGVHCAVLVCGGDLVAKSSDVGRHNAVDKVIGHAVLAGIDLSRCILGCSGRQPAGMVIKASRAGVPVIISRAASTDQGTALADAAGITLICFSRGERFTIYTHPWRVTGLDPTPIPLSRT
jgi:FdhD protein